MIYIYVYMYMHMHMCVCKEDMKLREGHFEEES